MIYESDEEATRRSFHFQTLLFLQDWTVVVRIVRASELKEGTMGQVEYSREKNMAAIKLVSPLDYIDSDESFPLDHDELLLHELMHIKLGWLDHFAPDKGRLEQAYWHEQLELTIDTVARTLAKLVHTSSDS